MGAGLVTVCVISALSHIVDPSGHSPCDESGDEVERVSEPVRRVRCSRLGAFDNLCNLVGTHNGIEGGSLKEIQRIAGPIGMTWKHPDAPPVHLPGFKIIY